MEFEFHTVETQVSYGWNSSFMRLKINFLAGGNLRAYGKKFMGIRMRFQEEMRVALKQGVSVIFRTLNTEGRNRRKLAVNEVSRSAELANNNIYLLKELSDFSSVGFLMGA